MEDHPMTTTVLLAGATGMLGNRIAAHLLDQPDVSLRLLLRASARADADKAQTVDALVARGAVVATGDVTDPASLDAATTGVEVVVSALQGGPDIIVDGQVALAQARLATGPGASCRPTTRSTCSPLRGAHRSSTCAGEPPLPSTPSRCRWSTS